MSGHSKWSTIRRQKAIVDAKRGAIFTKLANLITVAARDGADPEMNPSLRAAIDKAREANMPKDNIERAIKKGTGDLASNPVEEIYYEGLGPAGIHFIVKCLTDNKNRSASNIRHLFTKNGGSLATVSWNFDLFGVIIIDSTVVESKQINLEELQLGLIDQGIVDFDKNNKKIIIKTVAKDLKMIVDFLERSYHLKPESASIEHLAKEKQTLSSFEKISLDKFMEELEDNEDVGDYYHNIA